MYRSNFPAQWQMSLRSAFYALLIISMLWIPLPADVVAAPSFSEESTLRMICEEEGEQTEQADTDDNSLSDCESDMEPPLRRPTPTPNVPSRVPHGRINTGGR